MCDEGGVRNKSITVKLTYKETKLVCGGGVSEKYFLTGRGSTVWSEHDWGETHEASKDVKR